MTTATAHTEPMPGLEQFSTLLGDMRERTLGEIKRQITWSDLPEKKQHALNSGVEQVVREIIRHVAQVTAARNYPAIPVTVGNLTYREKDDTIEVKMTVPGTEENWLSLFGAKRMTAVKLDFQDYMGERAPAAVMKDQPDLMDEAAAEAAHVQENTDRLEAGIKPLETEDAPGAQAEPGDEFAAREQANNPTADATGEQQADVIAAGADIAHVEPMTAENAPPKKRQGRMSAERRTRENGAAADSAYRVHS